MSRWKEYVEKTVGASPLGLLNKENYIEEEFQQKRYAICLECPDLTEHTKQCKHCGCFMQMKTKLISAGCPIGKW